VRGYPADEAMQRLRAEPASRSSKSHSVSRPMSHLWKD
jgi:hypothetical protein